MYINWAMLFEDPLHDFLHELFIVVCCWRFLQYHAESIYTDLLLGKELW